MDKKIRKENTKARGIFITLTRRISKKQIRKIEAKRGRRLSREEKEKIIIRNAKSARRYAIIATAFFALGGITTKAATQLLDKGKTEISIDADQYKDGIDITNVTSDRDVFINGIHVELDEVDANEKLEKDVIEIVDNFKGSEEMIEYSKDIYEEAYFNEYGKSIVVTKIEKKPSDNINKAIITIWGKENEEMEAKIIEKVERDLNRVENADRITNLGENVLLENSKVVYDIIAVGSEYASALDKDKNKDTISQNDYNFLRDMESSWKKSYTNYLLEFKKEQRGKITQNGKNETIQENDQRD